MMLLTKPKKIRFGWGGLLFYGSIAPANQPPLFKIKKKEGLRE